MNFSGKGQVTIPRRLRNRYGLKPETEVVFEETAAGVLIKPDCRIGVCLVISRGRRFQRSFGEMRVLNGQFACGGQAGRVGEQPIATTVAR